MIGEHEFAMTVNGNTGGVEVRWIPDNKYSEAHYAAFISVPFKDGRWEHLFIYDKSKLDEAIEKAKSYLKSELRTCTLIC